MHTALCALCARCGVRSWRRLTMARPSATEEFFFDLRGFSILKNALSRDELAQINGWVAARAAACNEPGVSLSLRLCLSFSLSVCPCLCLCLSLCLYLSLSSEINYLV